MIYYIDNVRVVPSQPILLVSFVYSMIRTIVCFLITAIITNHWIIETFAYTTAVPQQRNLQYDITDRIMTFPNHMERLQQSALNVMKNVDEVQQQYGANPGTTSNRYNEYRRRPIVAGNWKLNPTTYNEAITLLQLLYANFIHHRNTNTVNNDDSYSNTGNTLSDIEVVVFPPYPFLSIALQLLDGSGIKVGVQNIGLYTSGAYTGEVSITQIQSMGIDYVLLGHSERRSIFDETDQQINEKILLCLKEPAISVILCVGETEEEYDSELLSSVCNVQVRKALRNVSALDVLDRITIAYEPIWAIGTGKVATPEQAQEAHSVIRNTLVEMYGYEIAYQVRIQYGGSVKPDNVVDIMRMPDVDGALVGGASLSSDSFTRIVDGAIATKSSNYLNNNEHSRSRELTAREAVRTKNVLGESAVWSTRDQALYWISAPQQEVWTWNLKDPAYRRLVGTDLGCVAILNDETSSESKLGSILVAGERAFLRLTMSKNSNDYSTGPTILCDRPEQTDVTRPNDGRVDRQGRLVFGMYNNYHRAPIDGYDGTNICGLYRLNELCQIESILPDDGILPKYRVSNCICFSPDIGDTMYFCDTPTRKIYAFDYPHRTDDKGYLSSRRLIWTMPSHLPGGPDGAQVDADGYLWVALSGASRVVRINPINGSIDMTVRLPVSSPTSVTFGGPMLDELFITTRGPDGGALYRVKLPYGIHGLPEPEYRIIVENANSATLE